MKKKILLVIMMILTMIVMSGCAQTNYHYHEWNLQGSIESTLEKVESCVLTRLSSFFAT